MNKIFLYFFLLLSSCQRSPESVPIDWAMLKKTTFVKKNVDNQPNPIDMPIFPSSLQALQGKWVHIRGYVIPVEETGDEQILVLSAYPYSNCFFCGKAGLESVIDVRLKQKLNRRILKDESVTFRGKLRLNDTDFMFFNYILDDAEFF